jgi:hypothetical protein
MIESGDEREINERGAYLGKKGFDKMADENTGN